VGPCGCPTKMKRFDLGLALFSSLLGPVLPSFEPLSFRPMSNGICALFSCIFLALLCVFPRSALLQINKHQNSCNSLVINPITKFGVHLSGFYASVGG
jgi:hypothetical protein